MISPLVGEMPAGRGGRDGAGHSQALPRRCAYLVLGSEEAIASAQTPLAVEFHGAGCVCTPSRLLCPAVPYVETSRHGSRGLRLRFAPAPPGMTKSMVGRDRRLVVEGGRTSLTPAFVILGRPERSAGRAGDPCLDDGDGRDGDGLGGGRRWAVPTPARGRDGEAWIPGLRLRFAPAPPGMTKCGAWRTMVERLSSPLVDGGSAICSIRHPRPTGAQRRESRGSTMDPKF